MSFDRWDTSIECAFMETLTRNNMRAPMANLLSTTVNKAQQDQLRKINFDKQADQVAASEFRTNGTLALGSLLSKQQIEDITTHLKDKRLYPGHISSRGNGSTCNFDEAKQKYCQAAYSLSDILNSPHLLEIANSDQALAIARDYLGCIPTLYSMGCWWSFPQSHTDTAIAQRYHRDPDDVIFCSLFIYLSDVGADNGPHSFLKGSHNQQLFISLLNERLDTKPAAEQFFEDSVHQDGHASSLDATINSYLNDKVVSYQASAGNGFIEDTYGLHRGEPLKTDDRLAFWARYGVRKTPAYLFDKTEPAVFDIGKRLGDNPLYQYVNRLIAKT